MLFYYEDSDYYAPHRDDSVITILNWDYKEPKSFEGGDIVFPFYDNYKINIDRRTTLLFPSAISHEVEAVKMEQEDLGQQKGRYVLTTFANIGGA